MAKRLVMSAIGIVEDTETYDMMVVRGDDMNEPAMLWQVVLGDNSVHYVFAESDVGAIGQAACGNQNRKDCEMFENGGDLELKATAIRLPFRLRGWCHRTW